MSFLILTCPSCEASFKLDPKALAPSGAAVRCTACATRWFSYTDGTNGPIMESEAQEPLAKPFIEEGDIPLVPQVKRELKRTPLAPAQPQKTMSWPIFVFLASCILLLGFLLGRETVLRNLPQTQPIYAALGLETNLLGVEFQNVTTKRIEDKNSDILIIEGKLYNFSPKATKLPKIMLSLREKGGKEIYAWSAPAPVETLESKTSVDFRARLASPPLEGYDVLIRLAQKGEE
jgi:predicted Zn finger-like uncharacterized protein